MSVQDSIFTHNIAQENGGGIKYDVYRPTLMNNTFDNNTAVYGPNIASYPIKIKEKDTSSEQIVVNNIGSGVTNNISVNFALYDHDGQIYVGSFYFS